MAGWHDDGGGTPYRVWVKEREREAYRAGQRGVEIGNWVCSGSRMEVTTTMSRDLVNII